MYSLVCICNTGCNCIWLVQFFFYPGTTPLADPGKACLGYTILFGGVSFFSFFFLALRNSSSTAELLIHSLKLVCVKELLSKNIPTVISGHSVFPLYVFLIGYVLRSPAEFLTFKWQCVISCMQFSWLWVALTYTDTWRLYIYKLNS